MIYVERKKKPFICGDYADAILAKKLDQDYGSI